MLDAALVGMGRWGQTLVNSVQGRNGGGIRFVAGATRSPDKARGWAAEKGLDLLPDLDTVLADPRVKAVVLATPHRQHAAQVIAAARAGRHVFVEKPFALSKAEAEAAVAACQEAGVVLARGHNRRFLPAVAGASARGGPCEVQDPLGDPAALVGAGLQPDRVVHAGVDPRHRHLVGRLGERAELTRRLLAGHVAHRHHLGRQEPLEHGGRCR